MNAAFGWALAVVAVAVGWATYGWRGVVLAVTLVVFWLLLQFSRAVRVLRQASGRPVGSVSSAVMLHSRLHRGMRLLEVLRLTRSLGTRLADDPETYRWQDEGGDAVRVELRDGRVDAWALERVPPPGTEAAS